MPYYDPSEHVKDVPIGIKLLALERLVKNIYHCTEIRYDVGLMEENSGLPSELYGSIYLRNLNDDPFKSPRLHDCCDDGLEYEVFARIIPDEFAKEIGHPDELVTELGLEIWFNYSSKLHESEKKNEDLSSK